MGRVDTITGGFPNGKVEAVSIGDYLTANLF